MKALLLVALVLEQLLRTQQSIEQGCCCGRVICCSPRRTWTILVVVLACWSSLSCLPSASPMPHLQVGDRHSMRVGVCAVDNEQVIDV